MEEPQHMKDQVVMITGAARGIGRGIAETLGEKGAKIAATDIELPDTGDFTARMDVTDAAEVASVIEACAAKLGPIDLLINNGGILTVAPVVELDPETWRRVMDVNATGTFITAQAVARHMLAEGTKGTIANIASIGGKQAGPGVAHYCASKFAVIGFTQALAMELAGDGITVNAVCPGVVQTEMIDTFARGRDIPVAGWIDKQLVGRPQTPAEIAQTIAFLHQARSITGQAINVDGGTVFH